MSNNGRENTDTLCVLVAVISLGMSVMGIDQVVKGAVLLAAVIFDVVSKQNESK